MENMTFNQLVTTFRFDPNHEFSGEIQALSGNLGNVIIYEHWRKDPPSFSDQCPQIDVPGIYLLQSHPALGTAI